MIVQVSSSDQPSQPKFHYHEQLGGHNSNELNTSMSFNVQWLIDKHRLTEASKHLSCLF